MVRVPADMAAAPEPVADAAAATNGADESGGKLTTSKLAAKLAIKTAKLTDRLVTAELFELFELRSGKPCLTDKGEAVGGEFRMGGKSGPYFVWPDTLRVPWPTTSLGTLSHETRTVA